MMEEIVAMKIGDMITNVPSEMAIAIKRGVGVEFLSKRRMQLMAECDFGEKWETLANSPTLFLFDRKTGRVFPPAVLPQPDSVPSGAER